MKTEKPQKPKRQQPDVADAPTHTAWSVSQTCDVSLRQLQWWDEQGAVSPVQIDGKRMYADAEVEKVRRIAALRRSGVGLRHVKKYLAWRYTDCMAIYVPTIINGTLVIPH
jgi:DNA-binding transcriptional MerR regulator